MRRIPFLLVSLLAACDATWKTDEVDADGDGYTVTEGDCWDAPLGPVEGGPVGRQIFPGAEDLWYDGIDADCAGNDDFDKDGDGEAKIPAGPDCFDAVDDGNGFVNRVDGLVPSSVNTAAEEIFYDGTDQNCDEADGVQEGDRFDGDQDGDGYLVADYPWAVPGMEAGDCDDTNGAIFPYQEEDVWYDGVDLNCDGNDNDQDEDGYPCTAPADAEGFCDGDCNDSDPTRKPDATLAELWYDGLDQNCDGNDGDQDGDGYWISGYAALAGVPLPDFAAEGDCADDPQEAQESQNGFAPVDAVDVYPGATERYYDGVDGNCDGGDDFDQDGDGEDVSAYPNNGAVGPDCNDLDAAIHTAATEIWYDGVDQDCDAWDDYDQDYDGDRRSGYGGLDCADSDAAVSSIEPEHCETPTVDDNCNGQLNEQNATTCTNYYADADADGYGEESDIGCWCDVSGSYTILTTANPDDDCDDDLPAVYPGAPELCATAYDDDCDSTTNETSAADALTWYDDDDGDDYGDPADSTPACTQPNGYVADNTDCDDTRRSRYPGNPEECDDLDNDCNGAVDDGLTLYYSDEDGDTYGDSTEQGTCHDDQVVNPVTDSTDCDDDEEFVYPGALEICDLQANDCANTGWVDSDEDGLVSQINAAGVATNLTWNTSTASITASSVAGQDLIIQVCRGTFYQPLSFSASGSRDILVNGLHGAGSTVLSGNGTYSGPLVSVGNVSNVALVGLTLTGAVGDSTAYGAAVRLTTAPASQGDATTPNLTLQDCIISGNSDDNGGAIAVGDSFNTGQRGGYLLMGGTQVTNNSASGRGGGAYVFDGVLECRGSTTAYAGFHGNSATTAGGAVYLGGTGSLSATTCDFGSSGADNNSPNDIAGTTMTAVSYGEDRTVTCTASGCN